VEELYLVVVQQVQQVVLVLLAAQVLPANLRA
jgi:hypothetical protein